MGNKIRSCLRPFGITALVVLAILGVGAGGVWLCDSSGYTRVLIRDNRPPLVTVDELLSNPDQHLGAVRLEKVHLTFLDTRTVSSEETSYMPTITGPESTLEIKESSGTVLRTTYRYRVTDLPGEKIGVIYESTVPIDQLHAELTVTWIKEAVDNEPTYVLR